MAAMKPLKKENVFSSCNLCSDNGTSPPPASLCWLSVGEGLLIDGISRSQPRRLASQHGTDFLLHHANGSQEDGLKSNRSWSISKYLQLKIIDCDESGKSQSTNKKTSLPVIDKDMGYDWL